MFTNDGHGGYDLRVSLKIMDKSDTNPSVYSGLSRELQLEIGGLLYKIFGRDVAATIDRIELSIDSAGKAQQGGAERLQRLCLRLHRDGDLALAMCGPFARMCVFVFGCECVCLGRVRENEFVSASCGAWALVAVCGPCHGVVRATRGLCTQGTLHRGGPCPRADP